MSIQSINPLNHKEGSLGRSDNAWQSLYAKELVNFKFNVESFEFSTSIQNNLFVSKDAGTQKVLMFDEIPTKQSQLSNSSNFVSSDNSISQGVEMVDIVTMTQSEYDALSTKDESTLYIIN